MLFGDQDLRSSRSLCSSPIPPKDHRPTLQGESCEGDRLQLLPDCGSMRGALAFSIPQGVSLRPQLPEAAGDGTSSWLRVPQITARKLLIHASHPALCCRCCHHMACFLFLISRKKPSSCFLMPVGYEWTFLTLHKALFTATVIQLPHCSAPRRVKSRGSQPCPGHARPAASTGTALLGYCESSHIICESQGVASVSLAPRSQSEMLELTARL